MIYIVLIFSLIWISLSLTPSHPSILNANRNLTTIAEESGWEKTGKLQEALKLCNSFQEAFPKQVRCEEFGQSSESRPLVSLVAN